MRTLIAVIFALSICAHLVAGQVPPIKISTMATAPYTQSVQTEDASCAQVPLVINTPASLAGTIVMAPEPTGGNHWLVSDAAAAAGNYNLTFTVTLPHTNDGIYGCTPFTQTVNDEGQALAGTLVMVQRRGGCGYVDKYSTTENVNASGVIIQNCQTCDPLLVRMVVNTYHKIPAGFISYNDGQILMNYMLNRRAAILANKANGTAIPAMYQQAVTATVIGTGKLDQGDFDALKQIASKMKMNYPTLDDTTAQRDWSDLLTNPTIDPCLNRPVGLYCQAGRVHSIWIKYLMLTGTLDPAWGKLTYLKYLTLSENVPDTPTGLTGAIPTAFCSLTNLVSLQMESNSLTSVPDCMAALPNLLVLLVDRNLLTTLPSPITAWSNNMVWFTASANKLTSLPVGLSTASKMVSMDLSQNPTLSADVSTLDLSSWSQVTTLTMHHLGLKGSFMSTAFNNMRNLQTVDFSFNSLSGSLPDFTNGVSITAIDFSSNQLTGNLPSLTTTTSLLTLSLSSNKLTGSLPSLAGATSIATLGLSDNQFTGGIPDGWRGLSQLTTLGLNKNKLSGPLDNIAVMQGVTTIDLSNNLIVPSPKVPGDIGATIDNFLPPLITTVNLDSNALVGTWSNGRLKNFKNFFKLILSNNGLQKFPTDLWSTSLTYLDVTNNSLSGAIPGDINSQTNKAFVTDFYFSGNPDLNAWPLPAWLTFTDPAAYVPSADEVYECRTLSSPTSRALVLKADPSFTLYNGCRCAKGRFGRPPLCDFVPVNADISPYDVFAKSNETAMQASNALTFSSILNGVVDNATISSAVAYPNVPTLTSTSNLTSSVSSSLSHRFYPSITDSWYGQDRLTIGLSTYWSLDLTRNRLTNNVEHVNNDTSLAHFYFPPTGPQPVRVITVRLHISAAKFQGPANTIVVFNDTHSQQGIAAITLNGHDWISKATRNTTFTSTKEYQARYRDMLATLTDPWVVEIPVYSSSLSLYFGSRDASATHFVMTYTYDYACPSSYMVRQSKNDPTYRCRAPIPPLESYDIPLRIAVYVMVGVAGLNILIQVAVLAWKWNSPIYRASSRLFVSMIFFFLAVMSGGAIQYAIEPDVNSSSPGVCVGRAWLTALPLAGILAVLLVKTWRLYKIFCSTKIMKVTNASDSDLMRTIGVICSLEVVLLIVFTVLKLSKPEETTMSLFDDPTTGEVFDRYRIVRCSHEDGFMPWMIVQLIVVFVGMVASTWLSFKTRHIPTAFNESSHIMATTAILLFFFLMIVPLDFWLQDRPEVGVLLQGFGQAFLAFSITSMVLGPKTFIAISYSEQDQTAMTKEITTGPSANTRSSITNSSSSNLNNARPSVSGPAIAKTTSGGSSSALNKGAAGNAAERGSIAGASKVPAFGTKAAPVSDKPKQAVRPSFVTNANKTPQSTSMPAKSPSVAPSPVGPIAQPSPVAPATPIQIGREGPSDLPNGVNGTHTPGASPNSSAAIPIHFRIGGVPASPVAAPANVSPPASPSLVPLSFGAQNDSALDFVKRLRMRLPQTGARGNSPTRGSPPASPVAAPTHSPSTTSATAVAAPSPITSSQEGVPPSSSTNAAPAAAPSLSRAPSTEGLMDSPGEGSSSSAL